MGVEERLGLARREGLFRPGRLARLEDPQGFLLGELDHGRGRVVVPEEEDPAQVRPADERRRAAEPARVKEGVGVLGRLVAVGRAPVEPAVLAALAAGVRAVLLADDDVLAPALVEEGRQAAVELDRVRRHVELALGAVRGGPASGQPDEDDVVRVDPEPRVGQEPEEELRLLRARRADQDEAVAADVRGHAPHAPGPAGPGHALGDVQGQPEGQAPQRAVVVGVDKHPRPGLRVVERPRLPSGDPVDGVDHAVGFDVRVELGRGPVLRPEVVEVADVCPELDDGPVDVRVPLVAALVAQVALHLGDQGVAHPAVNRGLDRDGLADPRHGVVEGDAARLLGRLELGQGLDDPVHALLQVLHGGGVGQADVVVRAEGIPRHDGHLGLLEQVVGHAVGVADAGAAELLVVEGLDVREKVEGALGLEAGEARHGGQAHQAEVAPALELGDHLLDVVLGPVVGLEAGLLGDGAGVRGRVALDLRHAADDLGRAGGEADPPPGHGVGLRDAVDDDGLLLDVLAEGGEARELEVVVDELAVDLVGDDVDVLAADDLGQGQELVPAVGCAGRVRGVVEEEGLGRRRDRGLERLWRQEEAVLFARRDDDGLALGQVHALGVGDPEGRRDDDLLALVDQGLDEVEEGRFRAGGDDDLLGAVLEAVVLLEPLGDGLAEGGDAVVLRVFREIVPDGLDPGVLDVLRRREIRLADAQVDDVEALGLHGLGLGRDLERGGGADSLDFFRNHASPASTGDGAVTSSRLF